MSGALVDRVVGQGEARRRADVAVSSWLSEPRARTQSRFERGEVRVDGRPVAKAHRLAPGERIVVLAPPRRPAPAAPPPVPVRYADEHLVVVAKPAGLVVHPGAGVRDATLVDALRAMGVSLADTGDPDRPGIVHRLDRGTSGLLVVARSRVAHEGLVEALRARSVRRTYWALVEGVPEPPSATIDAPIGRARDRARFALDPAGRPAVTHYDLGEVVGPAAVLTVRLETGRTHQIRVHLSAVGHPVVGDVDYGASSAVAARAGLERPGLHARRLALTHPVTGALVVVEEDLPPELLSAVDALRGGSPR